MWWGGEQLDKEMVLLTKSKKRGNICVAGVDIRTGEWIRIVSEDKNIQNAVPLNDTKYDDGSMSEVLDIVQIRCKVHSPEKHQPENYIMDRRFPWKKKGVLSTKELLKIHKEETKNLLFYNKDRYVEAITLNRLKNSEKYSLILIRPEDICIHVKQWSPGQDKQVTVSFDYAGHRYWYIRITDTEFEAKFAHYSDGNYRFGIPCLFVISLGDMHTDGRHWKLIAGVLYF